MADSRKQWLAARDELVGTIIKLGFPEELGDSIARQLGSPKAMERMQSYLVNVKPNSAELIVDEMLAICSDIDAWHAKKEAERANASYNDILNYGLGKRK